MSNTIRNMLKKREVGTGTRKAILMDFADRASDDGSGIWASKATIAAETGWGKSTVIRVINEFVEEGLLVERGERRCLHGATTEYAINLAKIEALPKVQAPRTGFAEWPQRGSGRPSNADQSRSGTGPSMDQSQSGTGVTDDQSRSETRPVPLRDPHQSQSGTQTTLEPSYNHGGGGRAYEQASETCSIAEPREQLLEAMGVDPVSGITGPSGRQIGTEIDMAIARRWAVDLGLTLEQQLTVIRETMARKPDGPPNSFKFFDKPMARFAGELRRLAAEPLNPTDTPKRTKGHSHDRNGTFDQRHDEYLHRLAAGEIDRGPDPSDPWAR